MKNEFLPVCGPLCGG